MRVLYAIDSLDPAGAERSLVDLVPHLTRAGVELTIAVLDDRPGLQEEARSAGAEVVATGGRGRPGAVAGLRRLVRARRPDLVHTTLFEADLAGRVAARSARTPVVSSLVNINYTRRQFERTGVHRRRLAAARVADAATARLVRRFHANAEHVGEVMSERLRIDPKRIDVIPRGRDPIGLGRRTPTRRIEVRRALGVDEGERLLLAVARHEQQKGLDVLLEALDHLDPSIRLLVAGRPGNATADLTARAGERVTFLGARRDVADLLAAADVFVLPSRWEGFPGTVVEAMALEAPIVASDLPGVREAIGPEVPALLVPADDADRLADAVAAAFADPDGAATRAAVARRRFEERFTTARVAAQMVGFWDRALGG